MFFTSGKRLKGRNPVLGMVAFFMLLTVFPLSAVESQARWIWRPGKKAEYGERILLRKEFVLPAVPSKGFFNVLGDDHFTLFLNGEKLFHQAGFVVHKIDAKKLKAGKNVISAIIKNDKDIAGLLIYGEAEVAGKSMMIKTDRTWKWHSPDIIDQADWKLPGYDDSKWGNALEVSGVTTQNVWRRFVKPELFLTKGELATIRAREKKLKDRMDAAMAVAAKRLKAEKKVGNAEFVRRNNVPYISINDGKKLLIAPYFNAQAYSRDRDFNVFEKFQRYGKVGYEVASASASMEKMWISEDRINIEEAEKALIHLNSAFPQSYVIFQIHLRPPRWFDKKYPEELIKYAAADKLQEGDDAAFPVPRPSMASELWMQKSGKALEKIIKALEKSPYGKRIIGYQLNYGVYSEWHYYGMEKLMPDVSAPMQKAFTRYLKKKYSSDKALQAAWKDQSVSLATAVIPDAQRRLKQKSNTPIITAGSDERCQDFYDCMAYAVNDCQNFFNSTVRKACNRKVIIGNYSGYFFSMPYPAIAYQTRTPEMLKTGNVDYQVSPFSYFLWHRGSGGSGLIRSPFEAYPFHNKVAVLEADNRTHQATTRSGNTCKNAADSLGQISREFCNALTKGATLWYYDFNIFWYDYPEYHEFFPKLLKIWKEGNDATRVSEVAGVCDYDSIRYHTSPVSPNRFTDKITGDVCHEMFYSGAPFDSILLEDIGNKGVPEYKVYVFFNLVNLTPEKLKKVETLIQKGKTLVFICAPELEKKFAGKPNVIFTKNKVLGRRNLLALNKKNGVHLYVEDPNSVLFASRGLVGIHRAKAGPAKIKLPKKAAKIEQLLPVRKNFPASDTITYQHGTSETSLFRIQY